MSEEQSNLSGANYDVIRKRLHDAASDLEQRAESLNAKRTEVFGGQELVITGNERIRTENNCVPRNIVQVGGQLLFGYNVFIGLKKTTSVGDVFSVHRFEEEESGWNLDAVGLDAVPFLADASFQRSFDELFTYYAETKLQMLRLVDGKLLAVFQTGERLSDIKVFRWAVDVDSSVTYLDDRGERDHVFPPSHDFEWVRTTRDDHVLGKHPHVTILDQVFVETVGGDLTVKIEDNTEDGQGIYSEPVVDSSQSLDDAEISYARVGTLILLNVKPFGEVEHRYLVYDTRNKTVERIDAIGQACIQLPEDHGIVFPGGYYLQTGDWKVFDQEIDNLIFKRMVRAPNGEDVMFVFHEIASGRYTLYPYNLIRKEVQNPIECHGYTLFDNGKLVVFRAQSDEPTRVHPVQIWDTPFVSEVHAAAQPTGNSFLEKVGNKDLVRGISDCFTAVRRATHANPNRQIFEDLVKHCQSMRDAYFWLDNDEVGSLGDSLENVRETTELIIDEYEKVQALKRTANDALNKAETEAKATFEAMRLDDVAHVSEFMDALTSLRNQRGHLVSLQEVRYIDTERLAALEAKTAEQFDRVSQACVAYLLDGDNLAPLTDSLDDLLARIEAATKGTEMKELGEELEQTSEGLQVLSEVVSGLEVDDPTKRTQILETISEVFGHLNRVRAVYQSSRKSLMGHEAKAEFAVQMRLFGQSIQSALGACDTPEDCDEQLSRLLVQLEEIEGKFGEFEEFLTELSEKRDEVYAALDGRKQQLQDERNRRIENLFKAGERIVKSLERRSRTTKETDALNTLFTADPMVMKLRSIAEDLAELKDTVKADELLSKLKSTRQDALRGLRDKQELFSDGADLIRLGSHQFTVNTQALELSLVPRDEGMAIHLTGTGFYELISDPAFLETQPYWSQTVVSETGEVYRSEYLAATMLFDAEHGRNGLTVTKLEQVSPSEDELLQLVRTYAAEKFEEGYERGVHDVDAAKILFHLLQIRQTAGLLRFPPAARALGTYFWATWQADEKSSFARQAQSLGRLRATFQHSPAVRRLSDRLAHAMRQWIEESPDSVLHDARFLNDDTLRLAGQALIEQLVGGAEAEVPVSGEADRLQTELRGLLDGGRGWMVFEEDLRTLEDQPHERLGLALAWVEALCDQHPELPGYAALEAAVAMLVADKVSLTVQHAQTSVPVPGLLGQHNRISDRTMELRLDEFLDRLDRYVNTWVPGYRTYRDLRHRFLEDERQRLRIDEFQPRVMSAFVRNKLINEAYLPLIGDNLAKQLGAAGDSKRTDLMGLLLLISPPGYGKTTLMEYVANRLGLVFMKINGPSLGHEVTSLDPSEAPNATARQEVEKVNLALEMGNNVMLYLDDIQHTHPEFLQKFISLCDATRRIEGVWNGRTRTYDLRGKKFCVVMAGNPYTESGEAFQIPDMLANRADTYNLGDVLEGKEHVFALSYIENALTSNPALQPLSGRSQKDVYRLCDMAQGKEVPLSELEHNYSSVEVQEITTVLSHLFRIRDVLLQVNGQYVASASMDDNTRTEPRFQLQGSYRNMNKMAEKVVPAMTEKEVTSLINDHYNGEAQTLTTGAESNLLKLDEMRGRLSEERGARWEQIKKDFRRVKMMGGGDDDPVARVTGTIAGLSGELEGIKGILERPLTADALKEMSAHLQGLQQAMATPVDVKGPTDQLGQRLESLQQGLDSRLEKLSQALTESVAAAPAPPPTASSRPEAPAEPRELLPHLDLHTEADMILRHAVLLQVQRSLTSWARMQAEADSELGTGDLILGSTLPVMQDLTQSIGRLASRYVAKSKRDKFMDDLRREVAGTIKDLVAQADSKADVADAVANALAGLGENNSGPPPTEPDAGG